jgi:hypothetical protein
MRINPRYLSFFSGTGAGALHFYVAIHYPDGISAVLPPLIFFILFSYLLPKILETNNQRIKYLSLFTVGYLTSLILLVIVVLDKLTFSTLKLSIGFLQLTLLVILSSIVKFSVHSYLLAFLPVLFAAFVTAYLITMDFKKNRIKYMLLFWVTIYYIQGLGGSIVG